MNVGDKLDVLAEKNPPLHDWENPDWSILDDRRGNLPDFPLDCLGGKLKEWVERAANGAGVTAAHVSVPALGIASSLIGMARRVKASKSWLEPMTCWTGIVGASGTGKTPGIDTIKRVLAQIERDGRKKIDELRPNLICVNIDLNSSRRVAQVEEVAFAHVAMRGDTTRRTQRLALLKSIAHLRD